MYLERTLEFIAFYIAVLAVVFIFILIKIKRKLKKPPLSEFQQGLQNIYNEFKEYL